MTPPILPTAKWGILWLTPCPWIGSHKPWKPCATRTRNTSARVEESFRKRRAMNAQQLLQEISDYCRSTGLAESTFGRRAVNDGQLTARLRNGGRITTDTLDRIQVFMAAHPAQGERPAIIERTRETRAASSAPPASAPPKSGDPQRNFRFFDNRQKY